MKFEMSNHIAIQVKDQKKAVEFYFGVMGMKVQKQDGGETVLKSGDFTFYVEDSPENKTFFDFRVDDIAVAKEKLTASGCKVTKVLGEKSMMIADPYGMRFHLYQD